MTNQRFRNVYLDNCSHFCTASVVERLPLLASEAACRQLLACWAKHRRRWQVRIEGFVIMPDHIHILLRGSAEGVRKFMQYSLGESSRLLRGRLESGAKSGDRLAAQRLTMIVARGNGAAQSKVWKERFRCVPLDREKAVLQKLEYMHSNPVKKELADSAVDWPWSSYSHYEGKPCALQVDTVFE